MKKILIILLMLAVPAVHAFVTEDPNEKAYKEYQGVEVSVMGTPVYVLNYYTEYLPQYKNGDGAIPTVVVLGTPIEAKMTVKVPTSASFKVALNQDGTKKEFLGKVTKTEGSYTYLEYTLKELGEWQFMLESSFDTDFYIFNLVLPDFSGSTGNSYYSGGNTYRGSATNPNELGIQLSLTEYKSGDILTFNGIDAQNPDVIAAYAGMSVPITTPLKFNPKYKTITFGDSKGRTKTLTITQGETVFDKAKKYILPIMAVLAILFMIKKKFVDGRRKGSRYQGEY